jgi:signal transduction histidine kinase
MTDGDRDVARLRAENAMLDDQLKVLVRTEQRLFGSQRALDRELSHARALVDVAVASSPDDTVEVVVRRTVGLVLSLFRVDRVVVVARPPGSRALLAWLEDGAPVEVAATPALVACLEQGCRPLVRPIGAELEPLLAELVTLVEGLGAHATPDRSARLAALVAAAPNEGVALFAWRTTRQRPLFLAESIGDAHAPFLELVADHLRRAVDRARLAEALDRRARELADANERLTASLASLRAAQEALVQAQKMEAVGRLAGGVAHDFNNMLAVILGATSAALRDTPPFDPCRVELETIRDAAQRSVKLTRQLLTVARQHATLPREIALGPALEERRNLLARLLGEDVALVIEVADDVGAIVLDPAQLDQLVTNVAVNARDAGARRFVLVASALRVGAADVDGAASPRPGDYVELAFVDDGCGMDAPTLARAFDPFFTTKPEGKGTGLGLATVYGLVQQAGGSIDVDSTPGTGTTMRVRLPRVPRP